MTKPNGSGEPTDTYRIAATYFQAWRDADWTTLRSILAHDATFRGPLASLDGADACVEGLQGMSAIVTDVVVRKMVVDGPDAITWLDLHTSIAEPSPTANWSVVKNGKITEIRVTFDARPLAPAEN